mgnify:CR=1 FL=1
MRHTLTISLWALLGIGGVYAFVHLRQLATEHQHREVAADGHRQTTPAPAPQLSQPLPPPAFNPLPNKPLPSPPRPAIAIIIDDLGNQWGYSKRALEIKGDITLAILPFSPFGDRLAKLAEDQGREVILHAPMEPLAHPAWRDGLRRNMTEQELRRSLTDMLDSLPTVRGVNNHMGSALTQERTPMDWVMHELAQRGLYFIDSRTSPRSQALLSAQQHAIPSARRDVFLDNIRNPAAIRTQFNTLIRLAHKRGRAIAIGHPYPETLTVLEQELSQLDDLGVRLVPASHLLHRPADTEPASPHPSGDSATSLSVETHSHQREKRPSKSI